MVGNQLNEHIDEIELMQTDPEYRNQFKRTSWLTTSSSVAMAMWAVAGPGGDGSGIFRTKSAKRACFLYRNFKHQHHRLHVLAGLRGNSRKHKSEEEGSDSGFSADGQGFPLSSSDDLFISSVRRSKLRESGAPGQPCLGPASFLC
jgi:hypothetical protein